MISLRPSGFDELGLRRALSDRMLPLLVAAMAFLAVLALAGWFGTAALARHWQQGASAALTVQVPRPDDPSGQGAASGMARNDDSRVNAVAGTPTRTAAGSQASGSDAPRAGTRLAAVLDLLSAAPGVASARALSNRELTALLEPWLGVDASRIAIPLPAVVAVHLTGARIEVEPLSRRLSAVAPGTLIEDQGVWIHRLAVLARSLQACAGLALLLVAGIAAAVIAVATRAGLSTRREAIEIVHGLGATDSYIAGRFAARATLLATIGASFGALVALPILLALAHLAGPFTADTVRADSGGSFILSALPAALWLALPCVPLCAAGIGFATAHTAVRRWLRHLP